MRIQTDKRQKESASPPKQCPTVNTQPLNVFTVCFATVLSGNPLWDPKDPSASVTVCRLGGLHALVNVMSMSDRVIQYGEPGSDGVNVRTLPDGSDHPKVFTSSDPARYMRAKAGVLLYHLFTPATTQQRTYDFPRRFLHPGPHEHVVPRHPES